MVISELTEEHINNGDRKDFNTYVKESIGLTPLEVKFKKLDENAVIPTYAHDGDVGMDLTAIGVEYDEEHDMYIYHTGLAFENDMHYGMFLFPRSSNRKTDAYLCNHVGIADTAIYRGEIILCFKNRTSLATRIANAKIDLISYEIINEVFNSTHLKERLKNITNKFHEQALSFAPYKVGDRVAQMVILNYPKITLKERVSLSETVRGDNGFGSTGN